MKPQSTSDRLQAVIERHAGGVVRRFAQAIAANQQTVHHWLQGRALPGAAALIAMWKAFRIDPLWLLTGQQRVRGPVTLDVTPPAAPVTGRRKAADFLQEEIRRDRFVTVPLLADAIAGGRPREIRIEDVEDYAVIHADWCPHPEQVTCVRMRGDSMSPILADGSIIAIDHSRRDPLALDGKMVAFRQGNGASVKWCKVVSRNFVMGLPENKESIAEDTLLLFRDDEVDDCVIGRILWWWGRPS
jgi:phage repressor protein C with HTH and peptisase S24 domain